MENSQLYRSVFFDWKAEKKNELYTQFAEFALNEHLVESAVQLVRELSERESIGSLIIAEGFALPHIESKNVFQSSIIFVRLNSSIKSWEEESKEVRGILFLLIKEGETKGVLQRVKAFMKTLAEEKVIDTLLYGTEPTITDMIKKQT